MAIQVAPHRERPIDPAQIRRLYSQATWWPERTDDRLTQALAGAPAVGAWDGDHLVGFARAVTDSIFRAYIEDVVVDEQYRRKGVASSLVNCLSGELKSIRVVSLFCEPNLVPLYRGNGFEPTKQVLMHLKRL